jgi:hypothetical protein
MISEYTFLDAMYYSKVLFSYGRSRFFKDRSAIGYTYCFHIQLLIFKYANWKQQKHPTNTLITLYFHICFTKQAYYHGDKTKEHEIGWACFTHGR